MVGIHLKNSGNRPQPQNGSLSYTALLQAEKVQLRQLQLMRVRPVKREEEVSCASAPTTVGAGPTFACDLINSALFAGCSQECWQRLVACRTAA
jgi:hypothetical protein